MSQTDQEIVIIVAVVIILITISVIVLLLATYYNTQKKNLLKEKELMKYTFEAELSKTQLEVQEQTMQTIGADLHDNIGQLLSLTSLTLNSVEFEGQERARQKIDAAIDLTMRSIKEMRLLGKLLQGDQLLVLGLSEAIRHEISWLERSGRYEIAYIEESEIPAVNNPDKDLIMFRILQEVLNNIIKHARANQISIKLEYREQALLLQIDDNGIGFSAADLPADKIGMGLQNIKKRAAIVGGEVSISSRSGEGTCISILIPYP